MQYIGIDVSKYSHTACILSSNNEQKYITFLNTKDEFKKFWSQSGKEQKLFGVESTGPYHRELIKFLLNKKAQVKMINPIMTKQFTKATVRKTKTDLKDSLSIARLLTQEAGYYIDKSNIDNPLKSLTRGRANLVKLRSVLKLTHSMNNHKMFKNLLLDLIDNFNGKIDKCESVIHKFKSSQLNNLTTMVGISTIIGNTIIAETGDINRFKKSKSYIAFCGYDPKIRQSGHSIHSQGAITKRGSPYLRHVLFLAARSAAKHDPEIKAYYEKKRNEGKPYKVAMCAAARKLAIRVYTILKQNRPYTIASV